MNTPNPYRYLVDLRKAPLLIAIDAAKRQAREAARRVRWFVITVRHFVAGAIRLLTVPVLSDTDMWCAVYVPSAPVGASGRRAPVAPASYKDTPLARYERAALPRKKQTIWPDGKPSNPYGESMRKVAQESGLGL